MNDTELILHQLKSIELKLFDLTHAVKSEKSTSLLVARPTTIEVELALRAHAIPGPDYGSYKPRIEGQLKWYCDMFHTCEASLNGKVWLINESNGEIPTWNNIETTCTNGDVPGFDISQGGWLQTQSNSTECGFGWGKRDGKHDQATVWARFYCDYGYVTWRFHYSA